MTVLATGQGPESLCDSLAGGKRDPAWCATANPLRGGAVPDEGGVRVLEGSVEDVTAQPCGYESPEQLSEGLQGIDTSRLVPDRIRAAASRPVVL
jgi:hypothetical protein